MKPSPKRAKISTSRENRLDKKKGSAMLRNRTLLCTAISILAAAMLATGASAMEREGKDSAVRLLKTVPIPGTSANTTGGKMYVFDISFVDQTTQTYYLPVRSNAVVDVVDAKT